MILDGKRRGRVAGNGAEMGRKWEADGGAVERGGGDANLHINDD